MKEKIATYYQLTKPGIIYGNALPTIAGFFLASKTHINFFVLLAVLVGQSLIIASACVFNNYIDRDIDKKMARTKNRALVRGTLSASSALVYATLLGLIGVAILTAYTNILTVFIGVVGLIVYVVLYGITKRRGPYGTIVGSISGAMPPVAGYTAVSNNLDAAAIILFLILIFWQMPHFYAIAMYRLKDYTAAHIPVLPAKTSMHRTKVHIMVYVIGFILTSLALSVAGYMGFLVWSERLQ
jgi:protoheme IX farnesyltransferase